MAASTTLLACLVGAVWGTTDALAGAGARRAAQQSGSGHSAYWRTLVVTPAFAIPQLLNWCGSALFVAALPGSQVHVLAPVANAVSLAANAACSTAVLRNGAELRYLVPGVVCVAFGAYLCAS